MFTTLIPIALWAHLAVFQAASMHFHFDVVEVDARAGAGRAAVDCSRDHAERKIWAGRGTGRARPDEELAAIHVATSQLKSVVGSCQRPPRDELGNAEPSCRPDRLEKAVCADLGRGRQFLVRRQAISRRQDARAGV